ncbi:hypothetical protein LC653_40030 [Nostoc sp. CHAB 5784]|uniref:DUF6748 domain-containing protein n=1 Tax=Nostoc mirabile TaxID=2907820 RepID=UPI001E42511F|nr:DUF6748 domain-containing protein [Nostoc mirabile]MCC5669834.1 hypothetical protein [Nostoc mirabile CHAB5784]
MASTESILVAHVKIEAANKEIFALSLIAVGTTKLVDDLNPTKKDVKFVTTQFYLRVQPN